MAKTIGNDTVLLKEIIHASGYDCIGCGICQSRPASNGGERAYVDEYENVTKYTKTITWYEV